MKYKKRQQQIPPPSQRLPLYRHGVRTDDPNYVHSAAGVHKPRRGKPPMDPRYPPARYASADNYAYKGPTVVLPSHQAAPLIAQPAKRKGFVEEWPNWWLWLIVAGVIVAFWFAIIMVILYVFGELTGKSPVYKGYFG